MKRFVHQQLLSGALAGAVYFAFVFGAGFLLGLLRTAVLEPVLGDLVAVLVELPIILTFAWFICRWQLGRPGVADRFGARLTMGLVAFCLLIAAEFALAVWGFGMAPAEFLATYDELPRAAGLAGQVLFGALPLIAPAGTGAGPRASRSA